jgi:hypothetical protein
MRAFIFVYFVALVSTTYAGPAENDDLLDCSKYPDSGQVTLRGKVWPHQIENQEASPPPQATYSLVVSDGCPFALTGLPATMLHSYVSREVEITGEISFSMRQGLVIMIQNVRPIEDKQVTPRSNQAMERTATRCACPLQTAWTPSLRPTRAPGGRRSSFSR